MDALRSISSVALLCCVGCRSEPTSPPIQLALGVDPEDRVEFSPRSAFAEYLELPDARNELRITLASYEASCERFVPPEPAEASLTVAVVTPSGKPPAPGGYGWNGEKAPGPHGYAVPSARRGGSGHVLAPGGAIELERVELDIGGRIEGRLAFEFSGDAQREATHARGAFRARVCRSKRAEP
jgi:hypothetical protein